MTTRVNGHQGHQNHHAEQAAHEAQTGAEHAGQASHTHTVMQRTKMLRAKLQHNKQAAAFFRNKRFATSNHKPPSPSAQKLLRQFGQRPAPKGRGGKDGQGRGKDGQGRREDDPHDKREHEQGQGHGHDHPHDQKDGQQHGQGNGNEQNGQGSGQPQQHAPRDGQKRREKPAKFAIKKVKAALKTAPSNRLQQVAEQHRESPDQPRALAAAYTKAVLHFTSQIELGPLLAPLLVLGSASRMVLKREPARLHAQRNGALVRLGAAAGKTAAAAGLIGQSLDLTLARQRFGIEYSDDDQSLAMVKQRLLDALAGMPAMTAKSTPVASEKAQEVRTAPISLVPKT